MQRMHINNEIPKSFWGPKVGPRPHTEKGSLRSHDAAVHCWQFRPVTIWGPPRSNPGSAPDTNETDIRLIVQKST